MNTTDLSDSQRTLIAKNLFSRRPFSRKRFIKYYYLLLNNVNSGELEYRIEIVKDAELALDIYCEKTYITKSKLQEISELRQSLEEIAAKIDAEIELIHQKRIKEEEAEHERMVALAKEEEKQRILKEEIERNRLLAIEKEKEAQRIHDIESENNKTLDLLDKLKGCLLQEQSKKLFDEKIDELAELEDKLLKDYFSKEQEAHYKRLTNEFAQVVSDKVTEFNKEEEQEYNRNALIAIKSVFDTYKAEAKKYKKMNQDLEDLVAKLFSFDASRLTTEVQLYYNQVYSFIFSKLDNEGKYRLTELSLSRFSNK